MGWLFGKNQSKHDHCLAEMALELIDDGVIIVDKTGAVRLINPAALAILGLEKDFVMGVNLLGIIKLELLSGEPIEENNDLTRAIRQNQRFESKDFAIITAKSGRRVPVLIMVVPAGQNQLNTIITIRNIENELKEDDAQMEFISTASHEMRTPVAAIEGYLGLAINPTTATIDERAKKYLESAHEASKHLGRLFQDLLDTTKLDEHKMPKRMQPLELTREIKKMTELHLPEIAKKQLSFRFGDILSFGGKLAQSVYVQADTDFLREIVNNLMSNAIKYTPSGGSIAVKVKGEGERAIIEVSDTGIGVPSEDQGRIFQKFYRVDNSDTRTIGGTGLGLYLVKQRAEALGGRVLINSVLGKGSVFSVVLPRLSEIEWRRQMIAWENKVQMEKSKQENAQKTNIQV